jgi:hypothetical protein
LNKITTHLNSDDLDGLVPRRERATNGARENLIERTKTFTLLDPLDIPQGRFGETGKAHSGTPIGCLSDSDGVDTLVDTGNTLATIDVHEHLEG